MPIQLTNQKKLREVRDLDFCYICGEPFDESSNFDHDHVPPKSIFTKQDRQPLLLKTHKECNQRHSALDEKIGQLISLQFGEKTISSNSLRFNLMPMRRMYSASITGINIEEAVWRWIGGFHAALYRIPMKKCRGSLVTPFPKANSINGKWNFAPILPQHHIFVDTIKKNRAFKRLDYIVANNGTMTFECIWDKTDNNDKWLCIFGINIYNWKVMGNSNYGPRRGCCGCNQLIDGSKPENASIAIRSPILIPNIDKNDPYAP